jgi:4'-phosphopantetheinyl transferase
VTVHDAYPAGDQRRAGPTQRFPPLRDGRAARVVWRCRPIGDEPSACDWAALSDADLARAAGLTHPTVMTRFVVSRALLRETLGRLRPDLRVGPEGAADLVDLAVHPSGRLRVVDHPDLAVSLSHTVGLATAAVSDAGPVGIDVEPMGRTDLPPPASWLTPQECDELAHAEAHLRRLALLHLWVAKEAALKAAPGPGIACRRRIRIGCLAGGADVRAGPGPPVAAHPVDGPEDASWCGAGCASVAMAASEASLAIDWYALGDHYLIALAGTAA